MEPRARCNNAIHVLNHFKKIGVEESTILKGLSIDKDYISNPNNWITVKNWYKLIDNCQEAAPFTSLDYWHKIGFYMKDSEASKIFGMLLKLIGIKSMYEMAPKYVNNFNTYMKITINSIDH